MIEACAHARAGLLGNPSDGYYGKAISFLVRNFRARVRLYPSDRVEISPAQADLAVFETLGGLHQTTRAQGYYGGIRLIQALLVRLVDYCRERAIVLPERGFAIEYDSTIPVRLGLGGSSAIITAALRAICEYFDVHIPPPLMANLILEAETVELGLPAGLQDRVIQVYEGLMYMDFSRALMERDGYGHYERLDPALLPNLYLAYRTSLSEGTEVPHRGLRERWRNGDAAVIEAMKTWAAYAEQGRNLLLHRDCEALGKLIDLNFDLRARICPISEGNMEMIQTARGVGASAGFAGSGGAIVGSYRDVAMYDELARAMRPLGVAVIQPVIEPVPTGAD